MTNTKLTKIFLTFGQSHVHHWKGETLDKDCVVVMDAPSENEAREVLMKLFQRKFCTTYDEKTWRKMDCMEHYPRGYIPLEWEEVKRIIF